MTRRAPTVALLLLAAGACERPTAPTQLVYADRPVLVPATALGWSAVSVGGAHTCAIRVEGTLYCWGANASGQLGVGTARGSCGAGKTACEGSPRAVLATQRFTAVSAGRGHTCAIATDRSLFCWGENLRFETATQGVPFPSTPQPVLPGVQFLDVSAGGSHSCAVRTNGVVYCWGDGNLGALGRGDTTSSVKPEPILSSERFTRVRSGTWRSCGIALDGAAWCWGSEWDSNQSGVDFFHQRLLPHRIEGLPPLQDISVSTLTTCAVAVDGASYCWEANGFAQLGNGTTTPTAVPSPVLTAARFSSISAGIIQTCGLGTDGLAMCWGNNSFGQLGVPRPGEQCGDARLECSRTPIAVFGEQRFTSVATGFGNHSCGVTISTALLCWGLGSNGQLGDGYTRDRQSLPVAVLSPQP